MKKVLSQPFTEETIDYYRHRVYRMKYMKQITSNLKEERYKKLDGNIFDFEATVLHQHEYMLHHIIDVFEEMHTMMRLVNAMYILLMSLSKDTRQKKNKTAVAVDKARLLAEQAQQMVKELTPKVQKSAKVTDVLWDEWKFQTDQLDSRSGVKSDE